RQVAESYYGESPDWEWISTIDNDATTSQIRFLGLAIQGHRNDPYGLAMIRGVEFLLNAQYPNGCFPQVYPLEGSYHDAATFNDDATVNVLRLLQEVAARRYTYVNFKREAAAAA